MPLTAKKAINLNPGAFEIFFSTPLFIFDEIITLHLYYGEKKTQLGFGEPTFSFR